MFDLKKFIALLLFIYVTAAGQSVKQKVENIKIGFSLSAFSKLDFLDAQVAIMLLGKEMISLLGLEFHAEPTIYRNTSDIIDAYNKGNVDLLTLTSLTCGLLYCLIKMDSLIQLTIQK